MINAQINTSWEGMLYRGTHNQNVKLSDFPLWFGLDERTAKSYGKIINIYRTTRPITLLNISSPAFQSDFIGRVNAKYTGTAFNGVDTRKDNVLAPLGLPDLATQMQIIIPTQNGLYNVTDDKSNKMHNTIMRFVGYFSGKHRYSIERDGKNLDNEMVSAMKDIYTNVDGYICPIMWPSIHHNGFLYPEVCLFNPINSGIHNVNTRIIQNGGKTIRKRKFNAKKGGGVEEPTLDRYGTINIPGIGDVNVCGSVGMYTGPGFE